jgi:hypothetical protein
MHNGTNVVFEKGNYICEATVVYNTPQGKWVADSDIDHLGGYEVLDLVVYEDDYAVDKHSVTWEDVIRHYEIIQETNVLEQQLANANIDDADDWDYTGEFY